MSFRLLIALLPFVMFLCGCDLIEYHPYDARVNGSVGINRKNIERIERLCAGKDTIRFAVISDTQRWYDETEQMVKIINSNDSIDFVIHCGDLTDFGVTKEFIWMRRELNKIKAPYVCLIGNHDCLGTGEHVFTKIWGSVNFAFTAGDTRFVCLNTNAREYDHTVSVPDFSFISEEQDSFPSAARRTIVAMHAKPYSEQFDNNIAQVFEYMILRFPNLMFCLCGHDHKFMAEDLFEDGNIYYECTSAGKRGFLIFTLYPNGYEYREVHF